MPEKRQPPPHVLEPTKDAPLPTRIIFLDTESHLTPGDHRTTVHDLKLGIAQLHNREGVNDLRMTSESVFTQAGDFFNWIGQKCTGNKTFYLVAHNIVYDLAILNGFRELPRLGFTMVSLYSKGQVSIIRWKKDKTRIICVDNGNFFGGTLQRWGDIFEVPKIKINFATCTFDELTVYCRRDVEIMVKSWQTWFRFLTEHDCGGFKITVGSTAFNTWRHAHVKDRVYVHKFEQVLALERESYHGGRVECFYQGHQDNGPFYYVDINNMYGHIMRQGSFPIGVQGYSRKLPIKRMIQYLGRYNVIARVTVNVDLPAFVKKVNGFTAYPLGRFDVTLTTEELKLALSHGWIEKLHAMSWYRSGNIYQTYVDQFYSLRMMYRQQGNKGFETICKLLINSLYGKFGQTGLRQEIIGEADLDEIWSIPVIHIDKEIRSRQVAIGGIIYEEFHEGESYHAMPAIASHVTANARLYLFDLIQQAGRENTFYCDTDSLIVDQTGYDRIEGMISQDQIGKLKIELQSDYLTIHAPKEYEMSGRKRIKGIKKNAIEIAPGVFEQEQWPRLAGMIRSGMPEVYATATIQKHHSRRIRSGTVRASGWVDPFHLDE